MGDRCRCGGLVGSGVGRRWRLKGSGRVLGANASALRRRGAVGGRGVWRRSPGRGRSTAGARRLERNPSLLTLRWSERDSNRRSLLRRVRRARGKGRSLRGFSGIPSFSATTGPCGTQRAKPENRFAAATGRPERQRALAAALHPGEWGQNSHVSVVRHTPAYRMLRELYVSAP